MNGELLRITSKYWNTVWGLAALGLLCAVAGLALYFKVSVPLQYAAALPLIVFFTSAGKWAVDRSIPRNAKDKVGLLVAIRCSDPKEQARVREDFLANLRNLAGQGSGKTRLNFIELPDRISENLVTEEAIDRIRRKARAHFVINGQVRLRDFRGKPHHVIDIMGTLPTDR